MRKLLKITAFALLFAALFCVCVCAAEKTVYLKKGGTGDGSSPENALGTFTNAFNAIGTDDATIVLCDAWSYAGTLVFPELRSNVTITALESGSLSIDRNAAFTRGSGEYTFTWDMPLIVPVPSINLYGKFNSVTFGEHFSVRGGDFNFYGGVNATVGATTAEDCICTHPYTLNVYAGKFANFAGGNFRGGSEKGIDAYVGAIADTLTVNIYGGEFGKTGDFPITNNKEYDTFSLSGMSILAADAVLNISGGTFRTPIYAQGRLGAIRVNASINSTETMSDPAYYAIDGDIAVNISGGTFAGGRIGAYYTQAAYTTVMRGNFTVDITGGSFKSGTVIDATQVKAYPGSDKKASLTYDPAKYTFEVIRFDTVNGEAETYEEPLRIAFIGDSITEGHTSGDIQFHSYSAQMLAKCEAEGKEIVLSNFGVSAAGATKYSSHYYKGATLAYPMLTQECDADYYFVALGTNDYSAGRYFGSEADFIEEYTDLLTVLGNAAGVKKIFVSNATFRNADSVASLGVASTIRPLQERICKALAATAPEKYIFVDLYGLTRQAAIDGILLSDDDIHPTQSGYTLMANAVYGAIFEGKTAPETDYRRTDVWVSDSGTPYGAGTEDDPISWASLAWDLFVPDAVCTLHIKDSFTYSGGTLRTSVAPSKLTIVGEGEDPKLVIGTPATYMALGCATEVKHLSFDHTASTGSLFADFNDVQMGDDVTFTPGWSFYAGKYIMADDKANRHCETPAGASSDKDCTITLNCHADFDNFLLGNRRFATAAPYGTYSGDMTAVIGENVRIGVGSYNYIGIVGHNYLTGDMDVSVANWKDGADLLEYASHGSMAEPYRLTANTGSVILHTGAGVTSPIVRAGDFTGDGKVDIVDVLQALRALVNGTGVPSTKYNYEETQLNLAVIHHYVAKAAN